MTDDEREQASEAAARAVVAALKAAGCTVAVAESCTGGLIGHLLTEVPGASRVFLGAAVVYANAAKSAVLHVDPDLIAAHGAVSEPVALAMAQGARLQFAADLAIATSGIAGPDGGTPEKPVGTLCLGFASRDAAFAWTLHFADLSRHGFKHAAATAALVALGDRLASP